MFCRTFEFRTFSANDLASSVVANSILTNTSLGLSTPRRSVWPLATCLRPRGSSSNCRLKASKSPSITPTMKATGPPPFIGCRDLARDPMLTRPARRYGRGIRSSGKLRQVVGYAQGLQGQYGAHDRLVSAD